MVAANAPIVTIFGGSGFVGRYIARRMAKAGWRVRIAVRRPNEALFTQTYGVVGQVTPILANLRYPKSVIEACAGADAVVNCVGILAPSGKQTFDAVQDEGAGTVARAAAQEGVAKFVHVSAIGADAGSTSNYARTKAEGEAKVRGHFPDAVILRPSIVFGQEDEFFNRFAAMARLSPALPLVGPNTRFQPVFVDDVAAAAERALTTEVAPGVYELGGPEVATFRALMERMLDVVQRNRALVPLPFPLARIMGRLSDGVSWLSGGLIPAQITLDQVKLLAKDNVASANLPGLSELGVTPTAMDAVLEDYLYTYRPHGQYAETIASAKHLKD
ncbi:MAG: complex I NDUFA9 subunit family protein [Pseudomonadota bacterium]